MFNWCRIECTSSLSTHSNSFCCGKEKKNAKGTETLTTDGERTNVVGARGRRSTRSDHRRFGTPKSRRRPGWTAIRAVDRRAVVTRRRRGRCQPTRHWCSSLSFSAIVPPGQWRAEYAARGCSRVFPSALGSRRTNLSVARIRSTVTDGCGAVGAAADGAVGRGLLS